MYKIALFCLLDVFYLADDCCPVSMFMYGSRGGSNTSTLGDHWGSLKGVGHRINFCLSYVQICSFWHKTNI